MTRGRLVPFRRLRPPGRPRRKVWSGIADPLFYLRAVVMLAGLGLLLLPLMADGFNAALRPVAVAEGHCRILAVLDGDTVTLACAGQGIARARLIGFDTAELFSPKCAGELIAASQAKWALRRMFFGADKIEAAFAGFDRYGRRLVSLRLDGVDLADSMIRQGYARAYDGGTRGGWCGTDAPAVSYGLPPVRPLPRVNPLP